MVCPYATAANARGSSAETFISREQPERTMSTCNSDSLSSAFIPGNDRKVEITSGNHRENQGRCTCPGETGFETSGKDEFIHPELGSIGSHSIQ
jgi:hypothetical protein